MKSKGLMFFLLFWLCTPVYSEDKEKKVALLLTELDASLEKVAAYDRQKEQILIDLKRQLTQEVSPDKMDEIYSQIYKEYETYICDSAMNYARIHLDKAIANHNIYRINESKMQLARMYSIFTRFPEAVELLNSIDRSGMTQEELGNYYNSYTEVYIYWNEYSNDAEKQKYTALKDIYQDSALMAFSRDTYSFNVNYGRKCIEQKDFDQAEKILLPYLSQINTETRDYAILTSLLAYLYELKGDELAQKEYLARSAIADTKASVKENVSIRTLAFCLLNDNDVDRSNRYIKKSLEDANFYNARLRNIQIAKVLPTIDKAYQLERERHQKNLQTAIIVIGILSLFLIGGVLYLSKQMKKLSRTRKELLKTNENLQKTNARLSETNHIKEKYIGHFLNQCSSYIDKLSAYRKSLYKKAENGKMEELLQMLKSARIVEDELKEFYQHFDATFLDLFPHFVDEFNKLLPKEERIRPKHKAELTIELRIFALMRLGITDSAKIAGFLRYSITTIYNYRSKYRNKSLIPREKFEEAVMKVTE